MSTRRKPNKRLKTPSPDRWEAEIWVVCTFGGLAVIWMIVWLIN